MNNYYAMIHFGGAGVHGMLLLGYATAEDARKGAIKQLTEEIRASKQKFPEDEYGKTKRLHSFRRSFAKPWRRTAKREDPVLEMLQLPDTLMMHSGYWLGTHEDDYFCNKPKVREEQPGGYICSRLK